MHAFWAWDDKFEFSCTAPGTSLLLLLLMLLLMLLMLLLQKAVGRLNVCIVQSVADCGREQCGCAASHVSCPATIPMFAGFGCSLGLENLPFSNRHWKMSPCDRARAKFYAIRLQREDSLHALLCPSRTMAARRVDAPTRMQTHKASLSFP